MMEAQEPRDFEFTTTQRGAIAESIVAIELMMGSGGRLAPFKPLADDDGLDLLVYDKLTGKSAPLQIKSRFGIDKGGTVEFNIRLSTWRADPAARLLCVLMEEKKIAAAWLIPIHELEDVATLKGDKFVVTPSPKKTSRDKYCGYRVDNIAPAFVQLLQSVKSPS